MASVYIETTIPSYYCETRAGATIRTWRAATREWWHLHAQPYDLVTSRGVLAELRNAPPRKARRALELIATVRLLREPRELADVIRFYLRHRLMPVEHGYGDAYHLAIASLHRVDYLLTWNCRHLANANKVHQIAILNRRLGIHVPIITTPLTLVPERRA